MQTRKGYLIVISEKSLNYRFVDVQKTYISTSENVQFLLEIILNNWKAIGT